MCRVEEDAEAEAAAEKERQAKEDREYQETERERQLFAAEFQGQGHNREAAESLAAKRQRDKPRLERELREAEDRIQQEREFVAATAGTCPVCKRHVPVFDGRVLFHEEIYDVGAETSARWRWETCLGTGQRAWPPGIRYASQLPRSWKY
jgi:DNA repair exonuclease SbcCD ATPase subunit